MKRAFLIVGLLMGCIGSNYAQEAVTADEIIQRYIENCGALSDKGQEEMEKYTLKEVMTTIDNKDDQVVVSIERVLDSKEKKIYNKQDSDTKKYRTVKVATQDKGWHGFFTAMPSRLAVLKYNEKELTQIWLQNYSLVDIPKMLSDPYSFKREMSNEKEIDGVMCYCIIVTPKISSDPNPPTTYYFDKETGMLVYVENEHLSTSFKNYRTFGSMRISTLIEINFSDKMSEVTKIKSQRRKILDIQLGVADESLFTKEAVKNAFKK